MCESLMVCLRSAIIAVRLDQFTAFRQLALEASQGITVIIGAHGLGKTYLCGVCISMDLRYDV
jgi:ABC-type uncharacterized transport system ATPase subunit